MCKKPCDSSKGALDHYTEVHNVAIEYEYPRFNSFDEFKGWMMRMEKATMCRYVKSKTYKCEGDTRYVFVCHRSGFYESKSCDRKRQMKKAGLKKLNGFCPAHVRMIKQNSDGCCRVSFLKTHVGHTVENENELQHIYLTEDERKNLAAKISAGVPLRNILSECLSLARESKMHKKFGALKIRDLHNISAAYHLKQNQSLVLPQESVSINAFLERNADAILFYKEQFQPDDTYGVFENNDLVLIIMTELQQTLLNLYAKKVVGVYSIHGTKAQNFFVHTLIVLDNDNKGVVAAFAISNRNDESLTDVFLTCVKYRVGIIETNTLITFAEDFGYNSWTKIMSEPQHRLYCVWHVKKAWWQNLNKVAHKGKQKWMRQRLNLLCREADESVFVDELSDLLKCEDADLREFIHYFKTNYLTSVGYWAHCYRRRVGIYPALDVDAFHKVMKYVLGGDKKLRNLSHCLRSLTEYISWKKSDFKIKLVREKSSFKQQILKSAHASAVAQLERGGVPLEIIDNDKWCVASFSGGTMYSVEEMSANCSSSLKTCQLLCEECGKCVHQYSCTCRDYIMNDNMCEHIHVVCMFLNNSNDTFTSLIDSLPERPAVCTYKVEDYSPRKAVVSTDEFDDMEER